MDATHLKKLVIESLDTDADLADVTGKLRKSGVDFDFRGGFAEKVLERIYSAGSGIVRETEYVRDLMSVFYRIALPGIAAIILLLISLFFIEGSISFNSLLGLGNSHDETIICLLTGN